eukprot:gnl/Trimastix_PCT/4712.p1 GENE.gnl/Trimastix_PCT/4712~~gnl/Trimastix_PCT/4712.p1  ORF type:complete len:487 (+),score=76.22 gnl/Trimastix_PCT/4712:33-1493(+)
MKARTLLVLSCLVTLCFAYDITLLGYTLSFHPMIRGKQFTEFLADMFDKVIQSFARSRKPVETVSYGETTVTFVMKSDDKGRFSAYPEPNVLDDSDMPSMDPLDYMQAPQQPQKRQMSSNRPMFTLPELDEMLAASNLATAQNIKIENPNGTVHGNCTSDGKCQCEPKWVGPNCTVYNHCYPGYIAQINRTKFYCDNGTEVGQLAFLLNMTEDCYQKEILERTCYCPLYTIPNDDNCTEYRTVTCNLTLSYPIKNCTVPSSRKERLLDSNPACVRVMSNATIDLKFNLTCWFNENVTESQREIPEGVLYGGPTGITSGEFPYWVKNGIEFALPPDPPIESNLRLKFFRFDQLYDQAHVYRKDVLRKHWGTYAINGHEDWANATRVNNASIAFRVDLSKMKEPYHTGARLYYEADLLFGEKFPLKLTLPVVSEYLDFVDLHEPFDFSHPFPWWIFLIVLGVLVLAAGIIIGVVAYRYRQKKKKEKKE